MNQMAMVAAGAALALIGNASANMTTERRRRILKDLNKDLLPLAEDADAFKGAAPLLFGGNFEAKMKGHLESLKCLRQSIAPKTGAGDQFFRRCRSHFPSCGSGNYRGRDGGQRHHPYSHQNRGGKNFQKKEFTKK